MTRARRNVAQEREAAGGGPQPPLTVCQWVGGVTCLLYLVLLVLSIPGDELLLSLATVYRGCAPLAEGLDRDSGVMSRCDANDLLKQNGYDENNRNPLTVDGLHRLLQPRSRIDLLPSLAQAMNASVRELPLLQLAVTQPADQTLVSTAALQVVISGSLLLALDDPPSRDLSDDSQEVLLTVLVDKSPLPFPPRRLAIPRDPDGATVTLTAELEAVPNGLHKIEVELTLMGTRPSRIAGLPGDFARGSNVTVATSSVFYLFVEGQAAAGKVPSEGGGESIDEDDPRAGPLKLELLRFASPQPYERVSSSVNVTIRGHGSRLAGFPGEGLYFLLSVDGDTHDVTGMREGPPPDAGAGDRTEGAEKAEGEFRVEVHGITPGAHALELRAMASTGRRDGTAPTVADISRGRQVGYVHLRFFGPEERAAEVGAEVVVDGAGGLEGMAVEAPGEL